MKSKFLALNLSHSRITWIVLMVGLPILVMTLLLWKMAQHATPPANPKEQQSDAGNDADRIIDAQTRDFDASIPRSIPAHIHPDVIGTLNLDQGVNADELISKLGNPVYQYWASDLQANATINQEQHAFDGLVYLVHSSDVDSIDFLLNRSSPRNVVRAYRVDRSSDPIKKHLLWPSLTGLDAIPASTSKNDQIRIHMARAEDHYAMENYDLAKKEAEWVLGQDSNHAGALILRGKCHLKTPGLHKSELEDFIDTDVRHEVILGKPLVFNVYDPTKAFAGDITTVVTSGSGDREEVTLQPLGEEGTRYRGQLPTTMGNPQPGDMVLQTKVGENITCSRPQNPKTQKTEGISVKVVAGDGKEK